MWYKTILVTLLTAATVLFLIGCPITDVSDNNITGESKTTEIGEMTLKRSLSFNFEDKHAAAISWWESDITQEDLRLSNLLPNGKIKNNTKYDITISGETNADMDKFQFVFSSLKSGSETEWQDLTVSPTGYFQIKKGRFTHTESLVTTEYAETITSGAFGLSNQIIAESGETGNVEAALINVTITITVDSETKTTAIAAIKLKESFVEIPESGETISWWESDINESKIKLFNLLPNGEIKNNAEYEVTISGRSNVDMNKFQFVFTSPTSTSDWDDLSTATEVLPITKDVDFSYTRTLTTISQAVDHITKGALGLSNEITVTETPQQEDLGKVEATLSMVTITITEK